MYKIMIILVATFVTSCCTTSLTTDYPREFELINNIMTKKIDIDELKEKREFVYPRYKGIMEKEKESFSRDRFIAFINDFYSSGFKICYERQSHFRYSVHYEDVLRVTVYQKGSDNFIYFTLKKPVNLKDGFFKLWDIKLNKYHDYNLIF